MSIPYFPEEDSMEIPVADGYFGSRLPLLPNNTDEMTVVDGYFGSRTQHEQLPVVILEDEDPVKTRMPEPESRRSLSRRSTESDSQTVWSRVSFISERSTLPPEYTSRRHSYDEEAARPVDSEIAPLNSDCYCGYEQCITCVANGRVIRNDRRFERFRRGCTPGSKKRGCRFLFTSCVISLLVSIIFFVVFDAVKWKEARQRYREYAIQKNLRKSCSMLLPGAYKQQYTLPINVSSPIFMMEQVVSYEKQEKYTDYKINIAGFIFVEEATLADEVKSDEIKVEIEYSVSDDSVIEDFEVKQHEYGLGITTNRYSSTAVKRDECVFVKATVKVPQDMELDEFYLNSQELTIQLSPSLKLKVHDKATIETITGDIWSKAKITSKDGSDANPLVTGLQANNLLVKSVMGNTYGVWGLASGAKFESKSGVIDIGVTSLSTFPSVSLWAPETELSVTTISGDVAIHTVSGDGVIHALREDLSKYITQIKTVSGDIIGQYILGSSFSVQTVSGEIDLEILPISPKKSGTDINHPISVESDNKSGKTKIAFLEPTDSRIVTEPRSLLKSRRGQTVIGWIVDKKKKFFAYFSKYCTDWENGKHNMVSEEPEADADQPVNSSSESHDSLHPLLVDPSDVLITNKPIFRSNHNSVSGDIKLHYPDAFQGKFKGNSLIGDVVVRGKKLHVLKDETNLPVGHIIEGVHGDENLGSVEVTSVSGDIKLCVA